MMILLTIKEICQQIGVNEETVRRWIRSGELEAKQIGRTYCVEEENLKRFFENREGMVGTLGSAAVSSTTTGSTGQVVGGVAGSILGGVLTSITFSIASKELGSEQKIEKLQRVRKKLSLEYELLDFELEEKIRELKESQ
jgi:excisionase family DNA binding protein